MGRPPTAYAHPAASVLATLAPVLLLSAATRSAASDYVRQVMRATSASSSLVVHALDAWRTPSDEERPPYAL